MITASVRPDEVDTAIQMWEEVVAPTTRQQEGFLNAKVCVHRTSGKIRTVGLWATEADFLARVQWNEVQLAKSAELFTAPAVVEGYEFVTEVSTLWKSR